MSLPRFLLGRGLLLPGAVVLVGAAISWQLATRETPPEHEQQGDTLEGGHGDAGGDHTGKHAEHVQVHDIDVTAVFTFRPDRGETCRLSYRLAEPARVSVRVKKAGTRELYLATIVNWELREAGTHTETWDGRDYSGNVVDMTKATLTIKAENASYQPGTMPLDEKSPEEMVHGHEWGHKHGTHHPDAEEVPALRILRPDKKAELSGVVLIRCEVDKERRGYGNKVGYGVRYYVDSVLAHEEFYKPESDGRFSYKLDTTAFEDGEHTLYVGMCDHNEHSTSAGLPVVFCNIRK